MSDVAHGQLTLQFDRFGGMVPILLFILLTTAWCLRRYLHKAVDHTASLDHAPELWGEILRHVPQADRYADGYATATFCTIRTSPPPSGPLGLPWCCDTTIYPAPDND